jgi:uroporphyrin-III C-methyltransferase
MRSPKLTLVGAGPGDAELITLKGVKALQDADVILYDALANPALLDHASPWARKIFVGKRRDEHALSQEQINTLITSLAFKHGHVVRLKGGDPFLFGRGMEEIEVARELGIETDYIPGVSSAIAVPGLAGIPLTHRNVSSSTWIVSGTALTGEVSEDLRHASRSQATVVVLMGVGALDDIVDIFTSEGRSDSPVAVIQNGSLDNQLVVTGTIATIAGAVAQSQVGSPAIIVIGEVVRFFTTRRHTVEGNEKGKLQ